MTSDRHSRGAARRVSFSFAVFAWVVSLAGTAGADEFCAQPNQCKGMVTARCAAALGAGATAAPSDCAAQFAAYRSCVVYVLERCGSRDPGPVDRARPSAEIAALEGVWVGTYVCRQGRTGATATIGAPGPNGVATGRFAFYPIPENLSAGSGEFRITLSLNQVTGVLTATPGPWIANPSHYKAYGFVATVNGDTMSGEARGPGCGDILLERRR